MRVVGLAGAVLAASVLAGCWVPVESEGERRARRFADSQAEKLSDTFGYLSRPRDAEMLATMVPDGGSQGNGDVTVATLGWSGRAFSDEVATVDVRFEVTVLGDFFVTGGSATRCYRYTLALYRYAEYVGIDCPAGATAAVPSPSPVLILPPDTEKRLTAALRTATAETLAARVRAAFPDPGIRVDTAVHEGELVAAVGVPAERDCVVMVRAAAGAPRRVSFDQVWLEPGETGCTAALYLSPPR